MRTLFSFALLLFGLCLVGTDAHSKGIYNTRKRLLQQRDQYSFSSSSSSDESFSHEHEWERSEGFEEERPNGAGYRVISVCYNSGSDKIFVEEGAVCGIGEKMATGKYRNAVNESGWGILEVETSGEFEPEIQAYAAGVAEGVLTKLQIYYHYENTIADMCTNYTTFCKKLYKYLQDNLDWIRQQVLERPRTDLYWRQVNLTFTQMTGIWHGYSKNSSKSFPPSANFDITAVLMIQLSGELFDLNKFLKKDPDPHLNDPEPGHCSGLVKITENNTDLLMSHVSMSSYSTMNRVLKLYKFAYNKDEVPARHNRNVSGHTVSFSGYPAALASADDYSLLSSGLLSIETTISIFNSSLYSDKYIKPVGQLHCWVRSIVANQLAKTAEQWVRLFARYNSGTYNNQWTVVDFKKFTPGQELPNHDVVWILEQVPGYTASSDVTWFLRKYRYWPSYNIPYLTKISRLSGFNIKGAEKNWWRWGSAPRARIFQRDHHKVKDIETLKDLMRYNDYQHDEFSRCACTPPYTAEAGISARGDLNPANGTYEVEGMGHRNHGSLDYKGTNYSLMKQLRIHAIGGPTYDPLPPFSWATTDIVAPHMGQPTLWAFHPFITEWETPVEVDL